MKKQFFRVKQLADQTFLKADKSEVLNNEELHNGDQKVEYLRTALSAIVKKLPQGGPNNESDKRNKKCLEYHLGHVFMEQSQKIDTGGFQDDDRHLFNNVVRESGEVENYVAKAYGECEKQIEELVTANVQVLVDHDFPNVLKHKKNLSKYILDRDSANNRYQSTKKDALKDDLEEADTKVEQSRDVLAYEMFNLLANENDWAGYILQILKCQRAYHETALKHLEEVIPKLEKKIGDSAVKRIYGIPLEEHLRVTNKRIAYPLEICISVLSKDCYLKEEGLFRIAGGSSRVKRLRSSIDSGCFSCELIPEYEDVHVLASALKLYLRELPDPLLTYKMYNDWMQSMQKPENERLEIVKKLIATLPRANRENLSYLINFLAKIARHPENKMSSSNIAIVIAPALLWNKDKETNINMGNCAIINMLVELFIKEVDVLFPEDVSSLIKIKIHDSKCDDESADTISHRSVMEHNVSTENITDSPKINARRKKPAAPVPPMANKSEPEQNERFHPSGASTLNRPKSKATIGINTDNSVHNHNLVNLETTKTVEHKVITQPATPVLVSKAKPVQQISAQSANCDNKNYTTTVTHQIKPVAAPRSIEPGRQATNKADVMSKSATEITEVGLRKPEVAAKPEIPARPVSLQKRISVDTNLDVAPHRTQCSVYSVANKQQPSYVNVAISNDKFQPGHDNQIAEKERFLGHVPNTNNKPAKPEKSDATKSSENLGDLGETVNGSPKPNSKPSHTRARSDGNLVDLSDGCKTPPSPKSLNKPTQPPPPPPAVLVKKETDNSTDL